MLKNGAQADLVAINPEALRRFDPEASIRYVSREVFSHHQLVNRPDGVVLQIDRTHEWIRPDSSLRSE